MVLRGRVRLALALLLSIRAASGFWGLCADNVKVLDPRVASGVFGNIAAWIPRGVPTIDKYAEISGALTAQEYGHEPELLISSSSAEALGVALHGPSQLAFAAGAGLRLGPTDEMPSLCSVTADMLTQEPSASPTTSPAPTITSAPTAAPTAAPTYGTLSPTEEAFPGVCDEASSTLKPHVAVGAFDDADLWTPRGVPSTDAYVEVPGALSAHAYGHEPELLVSSAAGASARGLLLLGPSKLAFSAGAGLYLGETDSMPPLCHNVTTAGLTAIPTLAPTTTSAPTMQRRPVADASCDAKSDKSSLPRNLRRRHRRAEPSRRLGELRRRDRVDTAGRAVSRRVRRGRRWALGVRVLLRAGARRG